MDALLATRHGGCLAHDEQGSIAVGLLFVPVPSMRSVPLIVLAQIPIHATYVEPVSRSECKCMRLRTRRRGEQALAGGGVEGGNTETVGGNGLLGRNLLEEGRGTGDGSHCFW